MSKSGVEQASLNLTVSQLNETGPDKNTPEMDVSLDELVARAVQSIISRDEEPTEAAIQLEMQQIKNDQLVAYELYVRIHVSYFHSFVAS